MATGQFAFIRAEKRLSSCHDLNPLDYKFWVELEVMAIRRRHNANDSLKKSLTKVVEEFPLEKSCNAIEEWSDQLKSCVKARRTFRVTIYFYNS